MRNFGLHHTVAETENAWSEWIGFIVVSTLISAGILSIAFLFWLATMVIS